MVVGMNSERVAIPLRSVVIKLQNWPAVKVIQLLVSACIHS